MPPSIPYLAQSMVRQIGPSSPDFTEKEMPSQEGRVVIVTGSSSGMGLELARILYGKGATVYLAARSRDKLDKAYQDIKTSMPSSSGRLEILQLDLADLSSIKRSAEDFLRRERYLHVLVHNAGVMTPPAGSVTKQNYDLEMGTNCLGPFLFTQFLLPTLLSTTSTLRNSGISPSIAASRIVWTSSISIFTSPSPAMVFSPTPNPKTGGPGGPSILPSAGANYCQSKVGNVYHSLELARRYGSIADGGLISVALDPGLLKTELQRNFSAAQKMVGRVMFKEAKYGAYTELFAGFSPNITLERNGVFVIPWGKIGCLPQGVKKGVEEGQAKRFWEWCEGEVKGFR